LPAYLLLDKIDSDPFPAFMAYDALARRVVLNYTTGAATMSRGLADALFGPTWRINENTPATKTVTVKSHSRTRVIGGPSKTVAAHTYSFKAWPTMDAEAAQGGQACQVRLQDGSSWTVRVSGGMAEFCDWLRTKLVVTGVSVYSQRGTIYGPFGASTTP
jgi:hypothetical protein